MKFINFNLSKKQILGFASFAFILVFCVFTVSFGMEHYYKLDFSTGLVTATTLNVRSGPGIGVVSSLKYGKMYVQMFIGK